jgi:rRNA maturation protein Nop10
MLISSIDLGMDIPLESKIKWVGENVTGKEMAIIKRFHEHYAYGVKTTLEHKCSSCGGVTTFELPFSASEVFSPRLDESDEELLRFM